MSSRRRAAADSRARSRATRRQLGRKRPAFDLRFQRRWSPRPRAFGSSRAGRPLARLRLRDEAQELLLSSGRERLDRFEEQAPWFAWWTAPGRSTTASGRRLDLAEELALEVRFRQRGARNRHEGAAHRPAEVQRPGDVLLARAFSPTIRTGSWEWAASDTRARIRAIAAPAPTRLAVPNATRAASSRTPTSRRGSVSCMRRSSDATRRLPASSSTTTRSRIFSPGLGISGTTDTVSERVQPAPSASGCRSGNLARASARRGRTLRGRLGARRPRFLPCRFAEQIARAAIGQLDDAFRVHEQQAIGLAGRQLADDQRFSRMCDDSSVSMCARALPPDGGCAPRARDSAARARLAAARAGARAGRPRD
jgi:hypothetical protein